MDLKSSIAVIKGVGATTAERFTALGVNTVQDLLYFFPRRYNDFSDVVFVKDLLKPGKVTVRGSVESVVGRHIRRGLHVTEAVIADKTGKVRAVWFNQPYRVTQLAKGEEYFFAGTYDLQRNRYVLANPAAELTKHQGVSTARIVPVYPETAGLKSPQIRKIIHQALPLMQMLPETLPPDLVRRYKLMPIGQALEQLHFPTKSQQLELAQHRIAFEELLWLLLASLLNRQENTKLNGWSIAFNASMAKQFTTALPFKLTTAQRRAAWEILQDMTQAIPMNRLVQGDVGSGKTVVAAMAAFMAAGSRFQTAFMAPTEILAKQHASTLAGLLEPFGLTVGLLVGSTPKAAKQILRDRIAAGDVNVIVGTHALLQPANTFKQLGLVVIDEQHRFGVRQRAELLTKSKHMPHLLSMTATPIPRSLQLTVYGELEVSVIDELPKGRQPIATKVVAPQARYTAYAKIQEELKNGRQAYVVCPVIATGANAELKSVQVEHERLNKSVFKHYKIGLLHGQLKADQKEQVMAEFKRGDLDVLVSTTVVEVGVDVPNATVMLIESADRFGLAQLHQLRGRVGRGAQQSYCFLVPSSAQAVSQRLRELEQSNDGFYLAEADLALRGPGEIYGRAQHGKLDLSFVNLANVKLIKNVRQAAQWLLDSGQDLVQYKQLYNNVDRYRRLTSLN